MDFGTIIGFAVGVVSIFGLACGWDLLPYFDIPSVGLVFGGCITTILMSVPLEKVKKMPAVFMLAFKSGKGDVEGIIKQFLQYSETARKEGMLALEGVIEDIPDPFARKGMQLAIDGTDPETVSLILNSKIDEIGRRHEENRRGWELCRGAAPGWGAMGTVIGLVQMVKGGVEDPNALIMGIAVALLTTLYGSLVSTWFVGPICDRLAEKTADELLEKSIVTQAILSLQNGDAPRIMATKLSAFRETALTGGDA